MRCAKQKVCSLFAALVVHHHDSLAHGWGIRFPKYNVFRAIKGSPDIFADCFTPASLASLMQTARTAAASVQIPEIFSEFEEIEPRIQAAEIEPMLQEVFWWTVSTPEILPPMSGPADPHTVAATTT